MTRKSAWLTLAGAALVMSAGVAGPAQRALASTVSPDGIDATGAQDVTASLQSLIDNLPDGSTLAFTTGSQYRIEGTLHVKNKHDITIDGNGALFFATTTGDRTRSQWSFEGGSNIVVKDVSVKGANPNAGTSSAAYVASLEAQHAFNIWSTNGIELDHVTATDTYGDFVYIGLQAGGLAKNVYIHDSTFDRNGRQGISITGADGVRVIHNTISDTRRATFDLEPNGSGWGVFNVDIADNTIGAGRLNLVSGAGVGPESDVTFSHNQINRPFLVQIGDTNGGRRGPFTFTDNVATQTWGGPAGSAALDFQNVDGLTITGNTIPLQADRGDYAVKATTSCDVVTTGNIVTNAVAVAYVTPASSCATTAGPSPSAPTGPSPAPSAAPVAGPAPAPSTDTSPPVYAPSTGADAPSAPVVAGPFDTTPSHSTTSPTAAATPPAQAQPHATKSGAALAAAGGRPTKPKGAATSGHASGVSAVAASGDQEQADLTVTDTAATIHSPSSARLVLGSAAAAILILLLVIRAVAVRPASRVRRAPRLPAPTPRTAAALEVLPQRFAP